MKGIKMKKYFKISEQDLMNILNLKSDQEIPTKYKPLYCYTVYITGFESNGKRISGDVMIDGTLLPDDSSIDLKERKYLKFADEDTAYNYAKEHFNPCRYIDVVKNFCFE